jgi:hypothetical protein
MIEWDGIKDRRKDYPFGRRPEDREHCSQHCLLWDHHETDTNKHRKLVCDKILELKSEVKTLKTDIVGKYWFRVVVGFLCVGIAALGLQQNWAFKEILGNQKEFAIVVNSIENKQIEVAGKLVVFEMEIKRLDERQNILRDQHIKMTKER